MTESGDGGFCAFDRQNKIFYGEYIFLDIFRSKDGLTVEPISGRYWDGAQWQWKPGNLSIPDARVSATTINDKRALFIAPFIVDPNAPKRILAGGVSLWRTDDATVENRMEPPAGPEWKEMKPRLGAPISAIAIAQGDSNNVWVGHSDGSLFQSTKGTQSWPAWTRIGDGVLPRKMLTRIAIDPADRRVIYVTFGGYEKTNIWKTTNGGQSWTSIGGALPAAPVRTLVIHPRNSRWIYAGSEVGVFASEDGGTTWSLTNDGPTSCAVDELFWMGNTLVAATHGRGMWRIDVPLP